MAAVTQQSPFFARLPSKIPPKCLTYCDPEEVARFALVSKEGREIANQAWPVEEHHVAANFFKKCINWRDNKKPEKRGVTIFVQTPRSADTSRQDICDKVNVTSYLIRKTLDSYVKGGPLASGVVCLRGRGYNKIWLQGATIDSLSTKIKDNEVPFLQMAEALEARAAPVEKRLKEMEAEIVD
jgi:hypothetical protein